MTDLKLNLSEIVDDIFLVLSEKEKEVIIKRFALNNEPKMTLESIGKKFEVTRERVRQIEKIALGKLRRTSINTRLFEVNKIARDILAGMEGVMLEDAIVSKVLAKLASTNDVDSHIIKLALAIDPEMNKYSRRNRYKNFWHVDSVNLKTIDAVCDTAVKVLKEAKDVLAEEALAESITKEIEGLNKNFVKSCLTTDMRLKKIETGYGLMTWRHVNPKSIRDKAYIVLKKTNKPLHFVEIANKISAAGFDHKVVTTQAVHNELIRYDQFVLVGRGLYALKEWGYQEGTVSDVIEILLKKNSPMTKQEIIEGVLKQRDVKKGTISLNLQKNPCFERVGRAVYAYNPAKK